MVHLYFGWFFVLHKNSQENPLLNPSGWFYLSWRWRSPMTWNARVWRLLWSSRHQRPCDQKSVDHELNSSWVCFGDPNCVVRYCLQHKIYVYYIWYTDVDIQYIITNAFSKLSSSILEIYNHFLCDSTGSQRSRKRLEPNPSNGPIPLPVGRSWPFCSHDSWPAFALSHMWEVRTAAV